MKPEGTKTENLGILIGSMEIDGVMISPAPIPAIKTIRERTLRSVLEIMPKSYFLPHEFLALPDEIPLEASVAKPEARLLSRGAGLL